MSRIASIHYLLILAFVLYVPLIFFGYGADPDTYLILDTGHRLVDSGTYFPSRNPGYFVHDISVAFLDVLGGSILINITTVLMSLAALWSFFMLCKHFRVPHPQYLVLAMSIHPLYWVNSTSTMDYIWGLSFFLFGFLLLTKRQYMAAALFLGLSVGTRLSLLVAVIGILVFFWFIHKKNRGGVILTAILSSLLTIFFFLPSFARAGWTLSFLNLSIGGPEFWTSYLRIGRFLYKNIYFWGLPATIFLLAIIILLYKRRKYFFQNRWLGLTLLSLFIILSHELLFLKYPIENEYLLIILPFSLMLLGIGLQDKPRFMGVFVLLLLSFNFINFNLASPDVPGRATGATFGFSVEPGYLIQDIRARLNFLPCDSVACANKTRMQVETVERWQEQAKRLNINY